MSGHVDVVETYHIEKWPPIAHRAGEIATATKWLSGMLSKGWRLVAVVPSGAMYEQPLAVFERVDGRATGWADEATRALR